MAPPNRLSRRLLLLTAPPLGLAASTPVTAQGMKKPPPTGISDQDPNDPPGRGYGRPPPQQRFQPGSDSDPRDRAGYGRPHTGTSDSDPNDPAGRGFPRTGTSDSDPRDQAGRGRPQTGTSDSDPRDQAGRGRPHTGTSDSDPRDQAGRGRPHTGTSDSDPNDPAGRGGYRYRR